MTWRSMRRRRATPSSGSMLSLVIAAVVVAAPARATAPALPDDGRWQFEVTLDDKPVGEHRFEVRAADGADAWLVRSSARYRVTLLGIPVYRYTHEAQERWQGGCLRQLDARTDDNGKPLSVRAEAEGDGPRDGLRVQAQASADAPGEAGMSAVSGCLMSYAYWRPDLVRQTRLLNPQTGRVDTVRFSPAGTQTLVVEGRPQTAQGWQLTAAGTPLRIWYLPSGRWVGLDATVAGGRVLRYRLAG